MRTEDGSIIQDCLNEKPEAFGILVDKYKEGIYAFIYAELREIPVDIVKTSNIAILSGKMGKGNGGQPKNMQNAFFMAPKGEGGEWAKKADMTTARCGAASSAVNGKIYVIGGTNVGGPQRLATMEEYDPVTDEWTSKTDMPTATWALTACTVNGKIYAIGGFWDINNPPFVLSTVQKYDPVADKWTKKSDMPTGRSSFSASVVNGKIYAIGGHTEHDNWQNQENIAIVEEYDPEIDKWTKKADMPTARHGLASSVVNGKIYAIGGYDNQPGYLSTTEEYDPVADKWTKKADMSTARAYLSTSVLDGKIYAIGGVTDVSFSTVFSTVEVYDPVTDIWTKGINMPTGKFYSTASEVNGKIYSIGGDTGAFNGNTSLLSTVEEYTPEGWKEAVSPQGKLPKTWGNIKSR